MHQSCIQKRKIYSRYKKTNDSWQANHLTLINQIGSLKSSGPTNWGWFTPEQWLKKYQQNDQGTPRSYNRALQTKNGGEKTFGATHPPPCHPHFWKNIDYLQPNYRSHYLRLKSSCARVTRIEVFRIWLR